MSKPCRRDTQITVALVVSGRRVGSDGGEIECESLDIYHLLVSSKLLPFHAFCHFNGI